MITAFAVIYAITYNNIQMEIKNKLPELHVKPVKLIMKSGEPLDNIDTPQVHTISKIPSDYSLSFGIEVDANGKLLDIQSSIDMSNKTYQKAAELAWKNKNNSPISLDGKKWRYLVSSSISPSIIGEYGQQPPINVTDNKYQITFLDVTAPYETLQELLTTFLIVGLVMLVLIYFISLYYANRAIRPIAESWKKQKQFIADASHELKTPLAIINANSDALLANQQETIKSQKKWLNYIKAESDRMSKLVNDFLYLAKTENVSGRMFHSSFNISNIVNNVILSMEAIVFEKGIKLSHTIAPDIIVKGDSEQIKQLVIILLDNAIKYTNIDGSIHILLKKSKRQVEFSINNSGNGINKQDLPKVFDRFYRTDPSRNQESGGYGLGLSVAKAIINRHGGKLDATSIENESTTFMFSLKL